MQHVRDSDMKRFTDSDTASISTTATVKDPMKRLWCQTQWTNLSQQARDHKLSSVYFDTDTMLLDKVQNKQLWTLLNRLYTALGPEKAVYASPVMLEAGKVEWHNYSDGCKGAIAEIEDP